MSETLVKEILGNVSFINMGQSPDSIYYNEEGIGLPLVQGNADIKDRKSIKRFYTSQITKVCDEGDILMTVRAPVGYIGVASYESCVGRGVCSIKANGIDSKYLFYLLIQNEDNWKTFEAGTTFSAVTSKEVYNFPLLLIKSKTEQQHIAKILSTADAVIEKTQAAIAKYKAIKQGMLQDLFTRGIDLQTGKLRPRYEDAPELYKESKLGWIPKEWEVDILDVYVGYLKSGLSRLLSDEDIGIPVIISGNIQESRFDFSNLKYWYLEDPQGADTNAYKLNVGDILICFINSLDQIGKSAIFEGFKRDVIYTTNLLRMQATKDTNSRFLFYLLNSSITQNELHTIVKPAVNQASFTTKDFLKIPVPLVPESEQKIIADKLTGIDKTIDTEQTYLQKMQSLKKGLMEDLLSGRKQVKVEEELNTQNKTN
jgi:type I restriction enzyme S subunit